MTTSSSAALPARSPRPLIVASTCVAPAWMPASVLATARPRSSWQCTESSACSSSGQRRLTSAQEVRVLVRKAVADRVGEVDGRRAGADGLAAHARREGGLGASRVLTGELDLVREAAGVAARPAGLLDDFLGVEAELALHVDGAGGEKDVDARPLRVGKGLGGGVDVLLARPRKGGDGGTLDCGGDCPDAFEVSRRGDREPCLDDVDSEPLELRPDLHLLVRRQRDARRLLAVAQRRVEDRDSAAHCSSSLPPDGGALLLRLGRRMRLLGA